MRLIIGYFVFIAASFLALWMAGSQGATAEGGEAAVEQTEASAPALTSQS